MKNPFRGIIGFFKSIVLFLKKGTIDLVTTVREVRQVKKVEKLRNCRVVLIEGNNLVDLNRMGKVTAKGGHVKVDGMNRLFGIDAIYHDIQKRMPLVFISVKYHRTIPIERLESISPEIASLIRKVKAFKTLNLSEFDNPLSINFAEHSYLTFVTKAFEFLEEIPKRTIYFVLIIGFLLGAFVGAMIAISLV